MRMPQMLEGTRALDPNMYMQQKRDTLLQAKQNKLHQTADNRSSEEPIPEWIEHYAEYHQ